MSRFIKLISIVLAVALLGVSLSGCSSNKSSSSKSSAAQVTLTIWRAADDNESFEEIIKAYQQEHSNVKINYIYNPEWKQNPAQYLQESIDALATGRGPDIWSIRNDWMPAQYEKIRPAPDGAFANYVKDATLKTKSNAEIVKGLFVPVVSSDTVIASQVYGLPLAVDSLALYINQTILDKVSDELSSSNKVTSKLLPAELTELRKILTNGPKDWTEVVKITPYITVKQDNKITRSAIAMGLGNNIEQEPGIVSSLMLQNGTQITTDDKTSAYFQNAQRTSTGESAYPGRSAIDFYTGFATTGKSVYTWNKDFSSSARQAFMDNKLAMLIDDSTFYSTLKASNIKYSFNVIPLPQLNQKDPKTYANYWVETVTNNSKSSQAAWDFLAFATMSSSVQSYLSNTKKSSALLSKTSDYQSDATGLSVFSSQARIAGSWYKGPQPNTTDTILRRWADNIVLSGKTDVEATNIAAGELTTLLQSVTPPSATPPSTNTTTTTTSPSNK